MRSNVNMPELAAAAAVTGQCEHIHYAAAIDPRTGAELLLAELEMPVDKAIEAHGKLLPAFRQAAA